MSPTVGHVGRIKIRVQPKEQCHGGRPHVHAVFAGAKASVDIRTGEILAVTGFNTATLKLISARVLARSKYYMRKWNETRPTK